MSSTPKAEDKDGPGASSLKKGTSFRSKKEPQDSNSILKKESSYLNNNGQSKKVSQARALTFADDHGDALTEENFVNQLHYPQAKGAAGPKGCCTVS